VRTDPTRQRGFSFLEVLIAMSILLLGGVAVLSLFALGVNDLVQRRIESKLQQVRTEISGIVQTAVDKRAAGDIPDSIPAKSEEAPFPLSQPGFGVRIEFERNPFGGSGVHARAVVYYQGRPVKVLPPIPVVRSTIDPQ
jgi:prepilin-type N-terminal cleavage/methylation domain-containing protein